MVDEATKNSAEAAQPVLLAGGNPQIAKADGDAPVQAYELRDDRLTADWIGGPPRRILERQ